MKKSRFSKAYAVVFAMLCLVAIFFLKRDPRPVVEAPAADGAMTSVGGMPSSEVAPEEMSALVPEHRGRLEIVRAPKAPLPPMVVEPLFQPDARVKIGEKAKLQFVARDRVSGLPESLQNPSASVFHGNDPELKLPVEEVDNGVYEVPFTPRGPGKFQVVLNADGAAVASRSVGVAGAAGASASNDVGDALSEDPRTFRARTGARRRSR